jgi:diguanylate cyclase (GGDEF)-like protein
VESTVLLGVGMLLGAVIAVAVFELTIVRRRAAVLVRLLDRLWAPRDEERSPLPAELRDQHVRHAYDRLSARLAGAETLVASDALTGLPNRQASLEVVGDEIERAVRFDRPLSVVLLDVDGLHELNDRFGYLAGDAVLEQVGQLLRNSVRSLDICGRISGRRFIVALPETPMDVATRVADKLRLAVASTPAVLPDGRQVHVTVSCGVSGAEGRLLDLDVLLLEAEAAVGAASAAGAGRIEPFRGVRARAARHAIATGAGT